MNKILYNTRAWLWNFDLMTDAFYIEEDRTQTGREITEIERMLLVLGVALVPWVITICIILS